MNKYKQKIWELDGMKMVVVTGGARQLRTP